MNTWKEKGNRALKLIAKIISVIFHPLFMPVYGLIIIFLPAAPYGYLPFGVKKFLVLILAVNNVFLPLAILPFLRHMNLIRTLNLDSSRERRIPLIITTILYATTCYMIFRFPVPIFLKYYVSSVLIISSIITVISFRWMISIHSTGVGAIVSLLLMLCFRMDAALGQYLILSVIAAGLTLSSRLALGVHNMRQVWYGFFIGFSGTLFLLIFLQKFF